MKKLNKIIIAAASIFVLSAIPAFSIEWGGVFKSGTEASTPDFENNTVEQKEEVYLWLKTPFAKESPFYFIGEAVYKSDMYITPSFSWNNIIDVDLLKAGGTINIGDSSSLTVFAGRFNVADSSQKVFVQLMDGAQVSYSMPYFGISAFAGYTGFINGQTTTMLDKDGSVFGPYTPVYALNLPYVTAEAKMEFPQFINLSVVLEGLGFFDLRSFNDSRYYAEFSMSGPVRSSLYFKFTTIAGLDNALDFSNYTNLDYMYYLYENCMIQLGIEYASGAFNIGSFAVSPFIPVTSATACSSADSPLLSGVIIPNLSFTISTANLYASLGGKFVFDMPYDSIAIKGPEADFMIQYNLFSDLKFTGNVSVFYDLSDSGLTNYSAALGCAVSF